MIWVSKLKHPQQISIIGKLENQAHGATMFFTIEKSEDTTFEFLQNSVNILKICKFIFKKILNLLNSSENEYSKFATKNGTSLTVKQRVVIRTKIQ